MQIFEYCAFMYTSHVPVPESLRMAIGNVESEEGPQI